MLRISKDLPDRVLAISAVGKITAADYEKVLMPMVAAKFTIYGKVRVLDHIGHEFSHFSIMALLDDGQFGLAHYYEWERVTVVTDVGF